MTNINRTFVASLMVLLSSTEACTLDFLTDDEKKQLDSMALPTQLPPSPSNSFADNPAAAQLGQQFFFDKRFSGPLLEHSELGQEGDMNTMSCATCHDPARGGADIRALGGTSLGAAWTGRNSPTVRNAAHSPWAFWDGRRDSLWSQALGPIEGDVEMNSGRLQTARLIFEKYREPYEKLFGPMPGMEDVARFPTEGKPGMPAFDEMAAADKTAINRVYANFGKAIEAYERKLVDKSSPFDRFLAGDQNAMSAQAVRGARLFVGKAACNECHSGPMMADGKFHNHGVPQHGNKIPAIDRGRTDGIPQLLATEFNTAGQYSDMNKADRWNGLHVVDADLGAFKTPTLRNISKTGPYMHTGGFANLWDVINWYNLAAGTDGFSGHREAASLVPLKLTNEEMADLVEFMKALDGDPLPESLTEAPPLP
ncbi:MAG TPA: cytochrome c peroxidase [Polyangia bacterium]|nr:cytochrome c peroxidase [Polyangia bacterium]